MAKYVLRAALCDRIPLVFGACLLLCFGLSVFMGGVALTEQDQFSIIFLVNSVRLLCIASLILYVCFYFRRSFEARDIEALLTRPISRLQYLIGHYLGFQIMALGFTLCSAIIFLFAYPKLLEQNFYWVGGFFIELSILSAIAIFFGLLSSNSIVAILLSFSVYILGRLSGSLISIGNISFHEGGALIGSLDEIFMQVISVILPRFDLMFQSGWLIYTEPFALSYFILLLTQFIVFTGLILSAAYYDLVRKQF